MSAAWSLYSEKDKISPFTTASEKIIHLGINQEGKDLYNEKYKTLL
jgi:hypothetical protein